MSLRLLLPGRDRVCHGVSLPERDLLERDKLGGSIGVPSVPSWKVRPLFLALSAACGAGVVAVFVFDRLRMCTLISCTFASLATILTYVNNYPFVS